MKVRVEELRVEGELAWQAGQLRRAVVAFEELEALEPSESNRSRLRDILLELQATDFEFADSLIKKYHWMRGEGVSKFSVGALRVSNGWGGETRLFSELLELLDQIPVESFGRPDPSMAIF